MSTGATRTSGASSAGPLGRARSARWRCCSWLIACRIVIAWFFVAASAGVPPVRTPFGLIRISWEKFGPYATQTECNAFRKLYDEQYGALFGTCFEETR
jgi:hypothetical protein